MAVIEAQIVVPGGEARIASDESPRGERVIVVTTSALRLALEDLNARSWNGEPADIAEWGAVMPPGGGPTYVLNQSGPEPRWKEAPSEPTPLDEVMAWARWGFACMSQVLAYAETEVLPIVRDE